MSHPEIYDMTYIKKLIHFLRALGEISDI